MGEQLPQTPDIAARQPQLELVQGGAQPPAAAENIGDQLQMDIDAASQPIREFSVVTDQAAPESVTVDAQNEADDEPAKLLIDPQSIKDIIKVDEKNRGHRVEKTETNKGDGRFVSNHEMNMIAAHQDLIRNKPPRKGGEVDPPGDPEPPIEPEPPIPPKPPEPKPGDGDGEGVDLREILRSLPEDMAHKLALAQNEYMEMVVARERSTASVRYTKEKVEAVRQEFEAARREAEAFYAVELEVMQVPEADRIMLSRLSAESDIRALGAGIRAESEEQSEPRGLFKKSRAKFYNWWARQGHGEKFFSKKGLKGNVKKAAVMAAIGLPVGIAAGVAGAVVAGPAVGAVAAGALARGVSRGLMRSHIDKQAEGATVSQHEVLSRMGEQFSRVDEALQSGRAPESVTDAFSEGAEVEVKRNRVRAVGSAAIGAAAGLGGALLGEAAHNAFMGGSGHVEQIQQVELKAPQIKVYEQPPTLGDKLFVEPGSGIIREVQEFGASHGHPVSPDQAFRIYKELHGEFGRKIIDIAGTNHDTYMVGSDVRLSQPGMAHWAPGVEEAMREALEKKAA